MKTHQNRLELEWISTGLEGKLMNKSKSILSICLIGMSMLLCTETLACPCPPCPPCYTQTGSYPNCHCDWSCGSGSCCNFSCCAAGKCCVPNCCGSNQFCCGDGVCCDAGEVCCTSLTPPYNHYCEEPCTDEITDTTTCSEDNEDAYKCFGCEQWTEPTCDSYRDYTGLAIKTCYDGCPLDRNTSEEICYQIKECKSVIHGDSLCMSCNDLEACIPVNTHVTPCTTVGDCVINIACDITYICNQCEEDTEVIATVTEETCECSN
jgi:hypothetical protein